MNSGDPAPRVFDALLPAEMAAKAELLGIQKTRLDALSLFALAVLAGAFISFGGLFSLVVGVGSEGVVPYGVGRLLAGIVFSVGLILVVVGGAELFTGNVLVCLAVWLSYSALTTSDRILSIVPPIATFVAADFEHSIANMFLLPYAWLGNHAGGFGDMGSFGALTAGGMVANLVPVTLGNVVGGAGLVGAVYWFIYLRRREPVR